MKVCTGRILSGLVPAVVAPLSLGFTQWVIGNLGELQDQGAKRFKDTFDISGVPGHLDEF